MELILWDGDEVFVDVFDQGLCLCDGIYVLCVDDVFVVKWVIIQLGGWQIMILSDNLVYLIWIDVDCVMIYVVGWVIWFGCLV